MSELYELTVLSFPLLAITEVSEGVHNWVTESAAKGTLLGCWHTEIGVLGQLILLRSFRSPEELRQERERALLSTAPFHAEGVITEMKMDSYVPFPFLPAVKMGNHGGIYEFRTYLQKPGGLQPTMAGWQKAIYPAHEYTQHLVSNMYALDGPPRITHIWGFTSLEERATLRASVYHEKLWPPLGGPENILHATSTIALPERWSPLT